jgi:hypothetical protein
MFKNKSAYSMYVSQSFLRVIAYGFRRVIGKGGPGVKVCTRAGVLARLQRVKADKM